jgi:hypothetical protein
MSPDDNYCMQRSRLWHDGLWAISNGRPDLITLSDLRKKATEYDVPKDLVIPCLTTCRMEGLIMCIKDHKEIPFTTNPTDYEQFILTPKGSNLKANYTCS